jgi:hypothetical protein
MRRAGIIISLAVLIVASEARDRGQFTKSTPEMKAWFDSLKSGRGPCCSDADGISLSVQTVPRFTGPGTIWFRTAILASAPNHISTGIVGPQHR